MEYSSHESVKTISKIKKILNGNTAVWLRFAVILGVILISVGSNWGSVGADVRTNARDIQSLKITGDDIHSKLHEVDKNLTEALTLVREHDRLHRKEKL